MYTRKIKRKCGVRGCRNTVSYALSKTREMGNSVIICADCLKASLEAVEEAESLTFKEAIPVDMPTEATQKPTGAILEPFWVSDTDDTPEEETLTESEKTPKKRQVKKNGD